MDYEDLRKIQRMERNTSKTSVLDENFYDELGHLLQRYKDAESEQDRRTFSNILKVAKDILERREQKILMRALRCVRSKEMDTDGLVSHEKRMFEGLVAAMRSNREEFKSMIFTKNYAKPSEPVVEKPAESVVEETTVIEPKPEPKLQLEEPEKLEFKKDEKTGIIELPTTNPTKKEPPVGADNDYSLKTIAVKITKKIPKFVSSDLHEYGPFEANDVVELPKKEAELLSDRKFVEFI